MRMAMILLASGIEIEDCVMERDTYFNQFIIIKRPGHPDWYLNPNIIVEARAMNEECEPSIRSKDLRGGNN